MASVALGCRAIRWAAYGLLLGLRLGLASALDSGSGSGQWGCADACCRGSARGTNPTVGEVCGVGRHGHRLLPYWGSRLGGNGPVAGYVLVSATEVAPVRAG